MNTHNNQRTLASRMTIVSKNVFKGLMARAMLDNHSDSQEQEPDLPNEGSQHNEQNRLICHEQEPGLPNEGSQREEQNRQMSAMDKVIESLTNENWTFQVDREKSLVYTSGASSEGSFNITIVVKDDVGIVIVYALCPVRVPEGNKRVEVAEFLTRANYGIMIGNFEMDFRDGEVRYKGALEYADGDLTTTMIEKLIGKCAYTMDHYFAGLMKIIFADMDPAAAIREIEPGQAAGNDMLEAIVAAIAEVRSESINEEVPESPVIQVLDEDGATPVTPVV